MMTRLSAVAAAATAGTALLSGARQVSAMDYRPPSGSGAEYEYVGCFHDNKDDRVLGDKYDSPDMTTEVCMWEGQLKAPTYKICGLP